MLEQSYGLFFFLKQPKNQNADGLKYVYLRITVDGVAKELSTKRLWHPSRWNPDSGRAIGTKEDAKTLNNHLDSMVIASHKAKTLLLNRGEEITASAIKEVLLGHSPDNKYILALFKEHIERIESLIVTKDYAKATYLKYRTSYKHVAEFIQFKYWKTDITLRQLNYTFIVDYNYYLKSVKNCGPNSIAKYISNFKSVVLDCMRRGWIKGDPFAGFSIEKKEVIKIALNKEELKSIADKQFVTEKLQIVRDVFLFSCYTGLAYVDVSQLKRNQIERGFDNELWLDTKRKKTDAPTRLPLLPKAVEILKKYEGHEKCKISNQVLPVYSNQKMNDYLKEIAFLCDIKKTLTFHIARHTFATTVTLSNGVPIETVSKMLGHKSIKQTQHYARIQDLKVSEDMGLLKAKMDKQDEALVPVNTFKQKERDLVASLAPAVEALLF